MSKSKAESPDRYENISKQVQKAEADLKAFVEMLWEKHKAYASVNIPSPWLALKEAATRPDEHIIIFDVVSEGVGVKLRSKENNEGVVRGAAAERPRARIPDAEAAIVGHPLRIAGLFRVIVEMLDDIVPAQLGIPPDTLEKNAGT